jgi:hypothetical protein
MPGLGAAPVAKNKSVDIYVSIDKLNRIVSICHELAAMSTRKIWTRVFGQWPSSCVPPAPLAEPNRERKQREKGPNMSKYKFGFAVFAAVVFCATLAIAQESRGTAEQRAACAPDAFRLCASYIPDASKVESCLRMRKSELTRPSRLVFEQDPGVVASKAQ